MLKLQQLKGLQLRDIHGFFLQSVSVAYTQKARSVYIRIAVAIEKIRKIAEKEGKNGI